MELFVKTAITVFLAVFTALMQVPFASAVSAACPPLNTEDRAWVLTEWVAHYDGSFIHKRFSYEPNLKRRVTKAKESDCQVGMFSIGLGREERVIWKFLQTPRGATFALHLENGTWVTGAAIREGASYGNSGQRYTIYLWDKNRNIVAERSLPIPKEQGLFINIDK